MAYTKTTWSSGLTLTSTRLNNLETQYDKVFTDFPATANTFTAFQQLTRTASTSGAWGFKVNTDAQPRFLVYVSGKMEWGDGTTSPGDTNLYRSAADTLTTDDDFFARSVTVIGSGASTTAHLSKVTGDTFNRHVIFADGKQEWGTGTASRDTNLYRSAADTLKTDDTFEALALKEGGAALSDKYQPKAIASVYNSANQSITTGVYTPLTFDSETLDTSTMHDTATNNTRLTAPATGYYRVYGRIKWAGNATGSRSLLIRKNGSGSGTTTFVGAHEWNTSPSSGDFSQEVEAIVSMSANDWVELVVLQQSGVSLNAMTTSVVGNFTMERVA